MDGTPTQKSMRSSYLVALALVLLAGLLLLEGTKTSVEKAAAPLMRDASARAQAAFVALRAERLRRGFLINALDDPNDTGMIGDAFSPITTTLGSLESKRSTTNPNLAAVVVDMFTAIDLRPGDRVAVNLSGSFPCANIAVLCAIDAMGLQGVAISSVGASTYGANLPDFTYLDMEAYLYAEGLIACHSAAFSMGGESDLGLEMPEEQRGEIRLRLTGLGYESLAYSGLEENINDRIRRYTNGGTVRCFVNVGGNLTSFGNDIGMTVVPGGILTGLPDGVAGNGLVQRFLRAGVPVLHLLNIKGLMVDYNLPYDPVPLPAVGEGGVYWREGYRSWLVAAVCVAGIAALFFAIALDRGMFGFRPRQYPKGKRA